MVRLPRRQRVVVELEALEVQHQVERGHLDPRGFYGRQHRLALHEPEFHFLRRHVVPQTIFHVAPVLPQLQTDHFKRVLLGVRVLAVDALDLLQVDAPETSL